VVTLYASGSEADAALAGRLLDELTAAPDGDTRVDRRSRLGLLGPPRPAGVPGRPATRPGAPPGRAAHFSGRGYSRRLRRRVRWRPSPSSPVRIRMSRLRSTATPCRRRSAGTGGRGDHVDDLVDLLRLDQHFNLDLGDELHLVLGSPKGLGLAALPAEP